MIGIICKKQQRQAIHLKLGILCAGDRELAPFLPYIAHGITSQKAMLTIHEGDIHGVSAAALFSGVCKVNAAVAAQILIDHYHVDLIINTGTCGAMDASLDLFDTVISTESVYHDVAENILTGFHPWMESVFFPSDRHLLSLAQIAAERTGIEHRIIFGRTATGEAFITDEGRAEINAQFHPLSVDMETAAVAHVCHVNRIPFLSIRTVTDTPARRGSGDFERNCEKASAIAKNITLTLIDEIRRAGGNFNQ